MIHEGTNKGSYLMRKGPGPVVVVALSVRFPMRMRTTSIPRLPPANSQSRGWVYLLERRTQVVGENRLERGKVKNVISCCWYLLVRMPGRAADAGISSTLIPTPSLPPTYTPFTRVSLCPTHVITYSSKHAPH